MANHKLTIQMNDRMNAVLEELAAEEDVPKSQIIRRGLTLLKLAEDERRERGLKLALATEDGQVQKEIISSS